jgi:cellulose synthase (UDP-forming)
MLAAVSFPIYVRALINAFAGKQQRWHVTGGTPKSSSPFNFMIPQVLVFFFLLLTSLVAIWRDLDNSQLTLATAWNVTNTLILGSFMIVAGREAWRIKHPQPEARGRRERALPSQPSTTVVIPPELEPTLGLQQYADEEVTPDRSRVVAPHEDREAVSS